MKTGVVGKNYDVLVSGILTRLGARRDEVLRGPGIGWDGCIINVGAGAVLAAATDPMSYIPELGPKDSALLSVRSLFADLAATGVWPEYVLFGFNLPKELNVEDFLIYWRWVSTECLSNRVAVVGGHTGSYPGAGLTVVGSGTVIGKAKPEAVFPRSLKAGDSIIMTKSAAIEATAVLPRIFPDRLGRRATRLSRSYIEMLSVLDDARAVARAIKQGMNVTGVHDAAEGGIIGCILELVEASGVGARIYKECIPVSKFSTEVCDAFRLDPTSTLGQGSLIITCGKESESGVTEILKESGIESNIVGRVTDRSRGCEVIIGGRRQKVERVRDRYWKVYETAKSSRGPRV